MSNCNRCGQPISFRQIQQFPPKYIPVDPQTGQSHFETCLKGDVRYNYVLCLDCHGRDHLRGFCESWAAWRNHKDVYGCGMYERWSPKWLNPE